MLGKSSSSEFCFKETELKTTKRAISDVKITNEDSYLCLKELEVTPQKPSSDRE
jgi:hypothetical protein